MANPSKFNTSSEMADKLVPVNTDQITEKKNGNKMPAFQRRTAEAGRTS